MCFKLIYAACLDQYLTVILKPNRQIYLFIAKIRIFFYIFVNVLSKYNSWRRRKSFLFRKRLSHFYQVQKYLLLQENFRKEFKRVVRKSEFLCLALALLMKGVTSYTR